MREAATQGTATFLNEYIKEQNILPHILLFSPVTAHPFYETKAAFSMIHFANHCVHHIVVSLWTLTSS
jgi:hypothetical protein